MLVFDPGSCSTADVYKLMVGSIVPRPIALVSSLDQGGVRNLAPFSYFTACSSNPPVVVFCPIMRPTPPMAKDTLRNILETREFVVNIVSEEFVQQMNATAAQVGPEVDEFELSGLTPLESDRIKPPRVAESHVHMECRLRQPSLPHMERFLAGQQAFAEDKAGPLHHDAAIVMRCIVDQQFLDQLGVVELEYVPAGSMEMNQIAIAQRIGHEELPSVPFCSAWASSVDAVLWYSTAEDNDHLAE